MTTYKGYEITQCGSDRFIIRLKGENITTIKGSLSCVYFTINSDYEDMTELNTIKALIDYKANYKGYELKQVEAQKTEIYKKGKLVLKIGATLRFK